MDGKNRFTETDSEKLVKFLNFIAVEAKFTDMDVKKTIELYGLLNWAQQVLGPKIKDNILEVVAVHEPKPEENKPKKPKK